MCACLCLKNTFHIRDKCQPMRLWCKSVLSQGPFKEHHFQLKTGNFWCVLAHDNSVSGPWKCTFLKVILLLSPCKQQKTWFCENGDIMAVHITGAYCFFYKVKSPNTGLAANLSDFNCFHRSKCTAIILTRKGETSPFLVHRCCVNEYP